RGVVGGGLILGAATLAVTAGNYALNVGLGRWLEPDEFGDVALMVTVMLLSSVVVAGLQLATASIVARSPWGASGSVEALRRVAFRLALVAGALLGVAAVPLAALLQVDQPSLLMVMAVGLPVHVLVGVDRGRVQGSGALGHLAATFAGEAALRIVVTVVLVVVGWGSVGATIGLNAGFLGALALAGRPERGRSTGITGEDRRLLRVTATNVGLLMLGTAIINNGDIVISKMLLEPAEAGRYAAVALVGRGIFFVVWSIQQAAVPAVASAESEGAAARIALATVMGSLATAAAMTAIAWRFDELIIRLAFGSDYLAVSGQLGRYALASSCFAVVSTIVTLDAARGRGDTAPVVVAGAIVQTGAVALAGSDVDAIVGAQIWSMVLLLGAVVAVRLRALLKSTPVAVDRVSGGIRV
ncbi:MAG: hypothetical protein HKM97_04305, partial [Acidimicrobiia bacterium]|nr:hypothetical protein [Acidimicrobiia bacterium]